MVRSAAPAGSRENLTLELAATAARLIAEDGCDYATAKRKAVQLVLGEATGARRRLPENELVESELRRYLRTFGGQRHAAMLAELRTIALALMEYLSPFNPHLVGAVLNGTATEHSSLHLHLFTDSAKDVEIFLLNEGVRFTVEEAHEPAGALESIYVQLPRRLLGAETDAPDAVLSVLPTNAVRIASRFRSSDGSLSPTERSGRASLTALRTLLSAADTTQ
jgi:Tat protein secretion system quality control protein TatD with DNase activity